MATLRVIASGDTVDVVLPDSTEPQSMTFEGIGLEEGNTAPVAVLRTGSERITYPLSELRIEPDEDD
jgi:hypothetical protein